MSKKNPWRLSSDVLPESYVIYLELNFQEFTSNGKETIDVHLKDAAREITLHSVGLEIKHAEASYLEDGNPQTVPATVRPSYKEFETVRIRFSRSIPAGDARLHIWFSGKITRDMTGLYQTPYRVGEEERIAAVTQCEATGCRRIFPCFDEPDKKAEFKLSLTIPKCLDAVSNMPVWGITDVPGFPDKKQVDFLPTPPMSAYLFAFMVAELEYIEGRAETKNCTIVRVFTTPEKKEHGQWTLDVALRTLPFFEEWYDLRYPLAKLDFAAFQKFSFGAMENLGLITGRENAFLMDPADKSPALKKSVAHYVNHETAHMWFGDIVTMKWWDDLWLNEAFATFMDSLASNHEFPEWKIWDAFVAGEFCNALRQDSLASTHPVEVPITKTSEIDELFDSITYNKGAAVIRMIAFYLGDKFREGVRLYLKQHQYSNATTQDLWRALEEVSDKPVQKIMDGFTRHAGYPIVYAVETKTVCEKNGKISLLLTQKRFFMDEHDDPEKLCWNVPLAIKTKYAAEATHYLMRDYAMHIENVAEDIFDDMEGVTHRDWIKVNAGQTGLYRVCYSQNLFSRLVDAMKCGEITDPKDRVGLINDTLALARAGLYKTSAALELLNACRNEREYSVWTAITSALDEIQKIVPNLGALLAFLEFARDILRPTLSRIGWDKKPDEPDLNGMLRPLLITSLGRFDDSTTINEAFEQFGKSRAGFEISADIRGAVYSVVAIYGNHDILNQLFALYDKTPDSQEKWRILNALAGAGYNNGSLVERVLEFLMSGKVLASDTPLMLERMGSYDKPCRIAWNFVKANWEEMVRRFHSGGGKLLPRAIEGLVSAFDRDWMVSDAEEFLQTHPLEGGERAVKRALEKARSNTAWYKREPEDISAWLNYNVG